jgi:hypothetical protein
LNQLKSDNTKLETAIASVSDSNEAYQNLKNDKALLESQMKEYGGGKNLGKEASRIIKNLQNKYNDLIAGLREKGTNLDEIVLELKKYQEEGGFDRIEALIFEVPDIPKGAQISADNQKARKKIIEGYKKAKQEFKEEKRKIGQAITKGNAAYEKVKNEQRTLQQKWGVFQKKLGPSTKINIPKLKDAPLVAIFASGFKPEEFSIGPETSMEFRQAVGDAIEVADDDLGFYDLCAKEGQLSKLTTAQKTPYYYSNPSNPVSVLLNHSAGSGKTATMTLASSLFARADYLPIIVTTDALAGNTTYEEATFMQCADWNVQQIMAANNSKTFVEAVEKVTPDPTLGDVYAQGKQWYGDMAPGAWNNALKMTFKQFTAVCKAYLRSENKGVDMNVARGSSYFQQWDFLTSRPGIPIEKTDKGTRHKIFHKTVILMDEVHSMMDEPPPKAGGGDGDQNAIGDVRSVIKALWKAREDSDKGPVVISASATPGATGFEFVMTLNLLCSRNDGYQFDDSNGYEYFGDDRYLKAKAGLQQAFDAANPKFEEIAKRMAYGHVSYYDSAGSRSVPSMRPIRCEIRLTRDQRTGQEKALNELRRKEIHLVEAEDGSWFIESDFQQRYNRKAPKNDPTAITNFVNSLKRNVLVADEAKVKEIVGKINASETKSFPDLTSDEAVDKWEHNAPLISPLYYETIQLIKKNKELGVRKQFVYINVQETKDFRGGITLFCNMLESLLRFNNIRDTNRDKSFQPEGVYGKVFLEPPYGSDSASLAREEADKKEATDVLAIFNSKSNQRGAKMDVIVLDKNFQAGVSLSGVGAVYIVGIIDTETELVQSVARAFRNCRTDPNELKPTKDVPVYLMMPDIEGVDLMSMLDVLKPPDTVDRIRQVCKECAFDKDILAPENKKALKNRGKLIQAAFEP